MEEKNNREVNTGEMVSGSELTLGKAITTCHFMMRLMTGWQKCSDVMPAI